MCHSANSEINEFSRLQLAIDAMLDLGPDDVRDGPTGPDDKYLQYAREWWRYVATGMSYFASAPMRAAVANDADSTLTLADCINGLSRIYDHLQSLDGHEFTLTRDGMIRVNRRARRSNAAAQRRQGRPVGGNAAHFNAAYAQRLHAACAATMAVRESTPTPPAGTTFSDEVVRDAESLASEWVTFLAAAHGHALGGPDGAALVQAVADPPLQAEECINGLEGIRARLARMDRRARWVAFAEMDNAFINFERRFSLL
jgi:hypothetical protein